MVNDCANKLSPVNAALNAEQVASKQRTIRGYVPPPTSQLVVAAPNAAIGMPSLPTVMLLSCSR